MDNSRGTGHVIRRTQLQCILRCMDATARLSLFLRSCVCVCALEQKAVPVVSADGENDIRPEHKVILLCGPPGLGQCCR